MKLKTQYFIAAIAICSFLTGCELYYLPPNIQTHSHEQAGDLSLNLQGFNSFNGSASYAVTDHIFVGGSFMGYVANPEDSLDRYFFRSASLEGGYYGLDESGNLQFEIMGGGGSGTVGDDNDFKVDFNRFFIQPGIAFLSPDRVMESHINARFTQMQYMRQANNGIGPFGVTFFEPAYTLRLGTPHIKFHTQIGISLRVSRATAVPTNFSYSPVFFSIGANANLNVFGKR